MHRKDRVVQLEAGRSAEEIEREEAEAAAEAAAENAKEHKESLSLAKNFISWDKGDVFHPEHMLDGNRAKAGGAAPVKNKRRKRRKRKKEDDVSVMNTGEDFYEFDSTDESEDGDEMEEMEEGEDGELVGENEERPYFTNSPYDGRIPVGTVVEALRMIPGEDGDAKQGAGSLCCSALSLSFSCI